MKIKHIFSVLLLSIVSIFTLASCGGIKSVSSLYKAQGIDLPKDNVYENIELDNLSNIIKSTKDNLVYVFYGNAENFDSKTAITIINNQAKQFNVDKVYYLDAHNYNTASKRPEVKSKVLINDPSYVPTIIVYKDNQVIFDLSKETDREGFLGEDKGKLDYNKISGFIFRDECVKPEVEQ